MNKRDKDKLFILLIVVIYIAGVVAMIMGTKFIPWPWLIGVMVVLEYFVVQPHICNLYYRANNGKASIARFIPFWNEIMMFKPSDAIASLLSYVTVALSVVALYVPSEVVAKLFGEKVMFNYGTAVIRIIAVMLLINCIVIGISFTHVLSKIKRMHAELTVGGKLYTFNIFSFVLLFFPLLRMISLAGMMNVLIKLVNINNYTVGVNQAESLVEEN